MLLVWTCTVYGEVIADPGRRVFAHNDDSSLFIWWFAHTAAAVKSWFGLGPGESSLLLTDLMNHPAGVNGAWNTSVLGLALPAVPLTVVFGPVVAYNLVVMSAAPACAIAAALLLRAFLPRGPAFLGGFAYGFSTYVVAQSAGHLNLAFAIAPPLVALALLGLFRSRSRARSVRIGVGLGVLVGWQLYVSSELAAGLAIAGLVTLAVSALVVIRDLPARLPHVLLGGLIAVPTAVLIGLPLMLTMAFGPGAPRAPIRPHGVWNTDLLDPITPTRLTHLGRTAEDPIPRVLDIDPAEIGGYIGIVWLIFALITAVVLWRHRVYGRLVRIAALVGLVMFVLSLGSPILLGGSELLPIGPFRLVEQAPILGNVLPMRLVVYPTLAAAVLLAVGFHQSLTARSEIVRALGPVAAIVSLILVSTGPVDARKVFVPEFYSEAYAEHLAPGSVVKTLPRPQAVAVPEADTALVWQAVTGMHYVETGGYFIGSTDTEPVIYAAPLDALDRLIDEPLPRPESPATQDAAAEAVAELRASGVDSVVIAVNGPYLPQPADLIADLVAEAAGTQAVLVDGVYVVDLG